MNQAPTNVIGYFLSRVVYVTSTCIRKYRGSLVNLVNKLINLHQI